MIESLCELCFSPTNTTKKIVSIIADEISSNTRTVIDLTYRAMNKSQQIVKNDGVIFGVPVYSGRIPSIFISRMEGIKGNGQPAIIIVLYGNREYDDALLELKDIVTSKGFTVIAAVAFIGEHSLSSREQPIADGRPDALDIMKAIDYGKRIKTIIDNKNSGKNELKVPGKFPYKEKKAKPIVEITTNQNSCIICNKCITVCPIEAIPKDNPFFTDGEKCIRCAACIKICPTQARTFVDETSLEIANRLFETCKARKEPEIFLLE
jgi:ferredoxin